MYATCCRPGLLSSAEKRLTVTLRHSPPVRLPLPPFHTPTTHPVPCSTTRPLSQTTSMLSTHDDFPPQHVSDPHSTSGTGLPPARLAATCQASQPPARQPPARLVSHLQAATCQASQPPARQPPARLAATCQASLPPARQPPATQPPARLVSHLPRSHLPG
eukprot:365210-Chlamydomonas_euryale.AAC.8